MSDTTPPPFDDVGISRRSFIRTSSIAAGAAALLAKGIALANPVDGYPGNSGSLISVPKTETHSVTLKSGNFNTDQNLVTIQNGFNAQWPENRHGGTSSTDPNVSIGTGVITYQIVHNDAVLKSSNSEVKNRSEITKVFTNGTTFHYEQTFDTVRTWVYE